MKMKCEIGMGMMKRCAENGRMHQRTGNTVPSNLQVYYTVYMIRGVAPVMSNLQVFSFCDRAIVLIYILKNQLFVLKYTLKHSLIKNKLN